MTTFRLVQITVFLLALSGSALALPATAASTALPPRPIELPNSAVHELPAADGRRYAVWVDLPPAYADSPTRRFPVVFVADPNFSFGITRTVRDFSGQRGRNIEPFILVGLVHDATLDIAAARARDYTPTNPRRDGRGGSYSAPSYGEADTFLDHVSERVMPLVAATYRADMQRTVFLGHSYGSVLGLHALFSRPGMFGSYILGSPSLWFDDHVMLRREAEYAARHSDLVAHVHMVAGSFEQPGPTSRHYRRVDLVGDMRRFVERLRGRGYPNLVIDSEVAEGQDHFTTFHDVAVRGLLQVLPGTGPYTSG